MERVKILKPLFVEQTGLQYREGLEYDVPKAIAERHVDTGHMEILKQSEPSDPEKEITIPSETPIKDKKKSK